MEAAVDSAAARLRGGAADALLGWRERHEKGGASGAGAIPRKPPRGVFAPLAPQTQTQTPRSDKTGAEDVDWRALLRTLCRRFAGELVVEGKLLNQEELQVRRLARVGAGGDAHAVIALPLQGPAARFLVRCRDAPAARIGSVVAARVVKPHARAVDATVPVAAYRAEMLVAPGPDGDQDMTTMARVFGFDVRHFVGGGAASHRRKGRRGDRMRDYDDYEDQDDSDSDGELCANAVIMKHWAFSDLRGVRRLMEASELPPAQWTSLLTAPAQNTDSVMRESDAWSHVSLAAAQKTLWAQERVARGDALRAKGRLKESLGEYDSALRLDEAHGAALLRRGHVHTELRRYEDAIRDFERLCALEPTNEAAMQALLRAKGKLGHSKHVVAASFQHDRRSRSASRECSRRKSPPRRGRSEKEDSAHDKALVAFEEDRLRRLLEEEARERKRSRKRSSRRRSVSSSSSSSSSSGSDDDSSSSESRSSRHRKRSRHKKSKKSKKAKKASSRRDHKKEKKKKKRKTRHDEESSHRGREDDRDHRHGHSSDSSAPSTRRERTSRERRRRSRSRSRARSSQSSSSMAALEPHNENVDAVHPILARKPHRLWN